MSEPKLVPNDDPAFGVPCLECGSFPMWGSEEIAFHLVCQNEKCPMAIRAVDPSLWPQTKKAFDATLPDY